MGVKVGDRVSTKSNYSFDPTLGTVKSVDGNYCEVAIDDGETWPYYANELEPVAVAGSNGNQPKFKVGDRVEAQSSAFGATKGKIYTVAGYARPTDIGEWISLMELDSYSIDGSFPEKSFKPAPLTIREGAFYRTRDGRKVGPAEVSDDYEYPWRASGALYMDNGRWLNDDIEDDNDIIAEWADELAVTPTPTTGFTVPLDAPEFGGAESKFKAGDRVAYLNTKFGEAIVTEVVDANHVEVDTRGRFGICTENVKDLRLVAEATSAQEPPTSIADIVRRLERIESAMWQRAA